MKSRILIACLLMVGITLFAAEPPLRIFIRAGKKTHGPAGNGQHDGPTFLKDWSQMLKDRGAVVSGRIGFPSAAELENTDVIVFYTEEGGRLNTEERANLDKFLKRGGGIVAIHDSVCGNDAPWWKTIIGGAWEHGHSKWLEHEVPIYYTSQEHPITAGASNFEFDDEIYYDLHMMPEVKILASSWTPDRRNARGGRLMQHIYDVCPQMWTYEKDNYRAFVSIPGHHYKSFNLPHFRTVLLRGIAWAGKRDANLLTKPDEVASLRYPEGGPTAPEKAASLLELHPEFDIQLVAAEPLVNKVINLDWDPAGRMWVAETPEYPNGRRGLRMDQAGAEWKDHGGLVAVAGKQDRPARDRISFLTDPDATGRFTRKHIFYEGLELVTGFVFHKDGVIVSQAPDILWLRDTNHDGRADVVEKLYTGLGIGDTHAVINNLRWGFDGWIYATHGYSGGNVTTPDKSKSFGNIGSGVVRFKPDGSAFEQFVSKNGNTWGLEVTGDNEILFTQPTSNDLLNHGVMSEAALARGRMAGATSYKAVIRDRPSKPLIKFENLAYVQIDLVGKFTAAAGCAIYEGGTWPEDWNYSYFTTEPTINIAHHEVVAPEGPTFKAGKTRDDEFIAGRDRWFRPIETRIGPDGALYMIDWYNQAVIHNDTRGPKHNAVNAAVRPDRDHYFARIWRVNHKKALPMTVPNLEGAPVTNLVAALESPNKPVRFTAHRLLQEQMGPEVLKALQQRPRSMEAPGWVHRLWLMGNANQLPPFILNAGLYDERASVRKNAMRLAALHPEQLPASSRQALLKAAGDLDARVQLEALIAVAGFAPDPATVAALVKLYPKLTNAWAQSAVVGAAYKNPAAYVSACLAEEQPEELRGLVAAIVSQSSGDASAAAGIVGVAARAPAKADGLKQAVFESLAGAPRSTAAPEWNDTLRASMQWVLKDRNAGLSASILPLISRWDRGGSLAADVKARVPQLVAQLNSTTESGEKRAQLAVSLLGARELSPEILPGAAGLVGSNIEPIWQRRVLDALGSTGDAAVGPVLAGLYSKAQPEVQESVFAQVIKRRDWSLALLDALQKGGLTLASLNPSSVHRLRTHADSEVSRRAIEVIDQLRGPEVKEKEALINKFTLAAEKPGNSENGHKLFQQNCGVCHQFNGEGRTLAPDLSGMGVHGAHELIVHILDPNRMVEDNYMAVSIETRDGETYDGILGRDTRASVVIRNAASDTEIRTADIKSRRNTGRSLMPEGFEALGEESLRDIISYMMGGETRFRVIDMKAAFTADTRKGLFLTPDNTQDTLQFNKFGVLKAGDVPFDVVSPARSLNGNNIVVLKGGSGVAKRMPQKVELKDVNVKANRLHFLGGVGGWMYPYGGERTKDLPAARVTVKYADGQGEEFVLKNGVEFADWNGQADVPGSKLVAGAVARGQVRSFTRELTRGGLIQSITIESFDNSVSPVFVAITADNGPATRKLAAADIPGAPATDASTGAFQWGPGTKVLLVGGGSSHNYQKFFNEADSATLKAAGFSVNYTEDGSVTARELPRVEVAILSVNAAKWATPDCRKALNEFVKAGKGLVLLHPGMWYNFNDWPEYNRELAGGGARGHDALGEFSVNLLNKEHPITQGVTPSFKIIDELYYVTPDPKGTPIEVLAETSNSKRFQKPHPSVFVVKHPQTRIAGLALGHDARAHDLPEYKQLLINAARWAAGDARK